MDSIKCPICGKILEFNDINPFTKLYSIRRWEQHIREEHDRNPHMYKAEEHIGEFH